jgi:hypothetical protein
MARPVGLAVALLLLAPEAACKRGAPASEAPLDAGAVSVTSAANSGGPLAGGTEGSAAIFSLPIAGARVASVPSAGTGSVIAAGLAVVTHSVTAARIDGEGKLAWTRVAVSDVAWSADAELHAWPITSGAVIVWRGPVGKKSGHVAVVFAPDGRVVDGPFDVGSFVCATDDGLAWSEGAPNGATRVRLRTYSNGSSPHDDTGPATMADFTLTCSAHRAFAVVEGDEATPTKVYAVGSGSGAAEPTTTIAPMALGRDEERDLFPWTEGDELGLVRVSSGGEVQAATVGAGALSLVHAEKARVTPEDDIVGVDADARQVVLVTTHDESDACPNGRGGSSVHALRIPRQTAGAGATSLLIAPSACGRDVGPFWTNTLGRGVMVAWAERASRREKTSAPITGLAYRALEEGATTARVGQAADALTDAGCDDTRCYAVALVREPGSDGMKPEAMKILAYP